MITTYLGAIFYKSEECGIVKIKAIRYVSETTIECKYIDSDNKTKNFNIKELENEWVLLEPDAFLNFSIVTVNKAYDVIVSMQINTDKEKLNGLPWAVLRQNINNIFEQMLYPERNDGIVSSGLSVSRDTLPAGLDIREVLAADKLIQNQCVSIYIGETIDDILSSLKTKPYDKILEEIFQIKLDALKNIPFIRDIAAKQQSYAGCCRTLRQLMIEHKFMYDVHTGFKILVLDNYIIDNNLFIYDIDPKYSLNFAIPIPEFQKIIEKQYGKKLYNLEIAEYSKEYQLDNFDHYLLISDANTKVYICVYDNEEDIIIDNNHYTSPEERLKNIIK